MQKTIINSSTKVRANSIVLDDDWTGAEGEWQVPDGHEIVNGEGNTGFVWDGTQFVDPDPITEEEQTEIYLAVLRLKRNTLLTESDWTQYNDSPLTDEAKAEEVKSKLACLPQLAKTVEGHSAAIDDFKRLKNKAAGIMLVLTVIGGAIGSAGMWMVRNFISK
jgi:hypothetical protein